MGFAVYGNTASRIGTGNAPSTASPSTRRRRRQTHLVDMDGNVVHEWTPPAPAKPYYGFLRDNGNLLLRCYDGNEPLQARRLQRRVGGA